jgi:hypothetical protein
LGLGVTCVVAWGALLALLFGGLDPDDEAAVVMGAGLLFVVLLAAAASLLSPSRSKRVAVVAAVLYAVVFGYFRISFHRMMPDALLYLLVAVFYGAPLVAGLAAVVAGLRSRA